MGGGPGGQGLGSPLRGASLGWNGPFLITNQDITGSRVELGQHLVVRFARLSVAVVTVLQLSAASFSVLASNLTSFTGASGVSFACSRAATRPDSPPS
jgi:hypothetical protein